MRRSQTAATEFRKIEWKRTFPRNLADYPQSRRVKRMPRQEQSLLEFRRPSRFNESQIKLFVRSVNLVAHDRVPNRRKMHANLVRPTCRRNCANQAEFVRAGRFNKTSLDMKFSLRRRSSRVNHLFQPDLGFFAFALSIQPSIDEFAFPIGPAPNNRQILFLEPALLHEHSEFSGGGRGFRDENEAARFAIEPVHD